MAIPLLRISQPAFLGREVEYVNEALHAGALSMGMFVEKFERSIARAAGARYAAACSSGTSALHLALLALGVKPGDRVVMPACSYIATANAVAYCGAQPVFCDVDPKTWVMRPDMAEAEVRRTRAVGVITVDLYGVLCRPPQIPGVWVLQDSCEGQGLPIVGDAQVFSYYGNKIITCGEGGAVTTNRDDVISRVRLLRGQGTTGTKRYVHEEIGYNYRLTDLQAAIGFAQMEKLEEHLERRAELRTAYELRLHTVQKQKSLGLGAVNWVMPVLVEQRDRVAELLATRPYGIETRPVFPGLHMQPPYMQSIDASTFMGRRTIQTRKCVLPNAEHLAEHGLLLPLHLGMTTQDVARVCHAFESVLQEVAA